MDEQKKQDIQTLIRLEQYDLARNQLQTLAMEDDEALEMLERLNKVAPQSTSNALQVAQDTRTSSTENRKMTAGILAILLGGIGVHKFYLGDTAMGIVYFLFSWTFIPMLVGLVEGILYLTMSEEEFTAKYDTQTSRTISNSNTRASSHQNATTKTGNKNSAAGPVSPSPIPRQKTSNNNTLIFIIAGGVVFLCTACCMLSIIASALGESG